MTPADLAAAVTAVGDPAAAASGDPEAALHARMQTERLRSLGEMASSLVHEFSQPVAGIRGFAEGLLLARKRGWEVSEDELTEGLEEIARLTDRMAALIDHVRGFAREEGTPDVLPVDLADVVDAAIVMIGAQYRGHGIDLAVEDAGGERLVVRANAFLLEDALLALLHNAREALDTAPADGNSARRVTIRLSAVPPGDAAPGGLAELAVIDTGPGIPEEILPRVAEPFFTTRSPEGTGLGLVRVRRTAESLGGSFRIESAPGRGAAARIRLPRTDETPAETPA
jgi:two-component system C4-dicarboxylate transport sensor histidine kinase DctB